MFDEKLLLVIIGFLIGMSILDSAFSHLTDVWGLQFIMFFIGMLGMMVLMHFLGFDEGKRIGYEKAMKETEGCFLFLPHGGVE